MGLVELTEAYPWDQLAPYAQRAGEHRGGLVDLSIGTPVDATPPALQSVLTAAANAPGYPTAHGSAQLRGAIADWFARTRGVPEVDPEAVLPTIGSKEIVALLPSLLGLGPGDAVVVPSTAYPTYAVGARLAGADVIATDDVEQWAGNPAVALVWVNSPSNPTGQVREVAQLRAVVEAARDLGAIVASDECYAALAWHEPWLTSPVPSVLDPRVAGGSHTGLLAAYSLSKQSNLAGYRAAFLAGDGELVARLLLMRRHIGMMLPAPVQAVMLAAISDDDHVQQQRERYRARREALLPALEQAGFVVDHSEAGLYLWARPAASAPLAGGDCWSTLAHLADRGVLVGPGIFYGEQGAGHVRIALTATDSDIAAAVERLSAG